MFGQYNEGAPKFLDYVTYMDNIGFIPYDIVTTNSFSCGFNIQTDIIFINKNHNFNNLVKNSLLGITENTTNVNNKKHITVITYCSGYGYEVFENFTDSLYKTGFSGNLIFVIKDTDVNLVERLISKYDKVSYFVDVLDNPRQCQQKRYYIFKEILKNLKTDYVLLTDCRDVFFQRNIELYEPNPTIDVFFAGEGNTIGNCQYNKKWLASIELNLKEKIIEKFKDKHIICSGTTYGTLNGIKTYVNHMCDYMSYKIRIDYAGLDQGIHNYIIYSDVLKDLKVKILSVDDILFNTLQYGYKFMNEASNLVNVNKEVSYIVHQWDRLPSYMKERLPIKNK